MLEKLHWLIVSAEKFLKQSTRECNLCTDGCFLIRAVQTFYWCVRRWHYNERTSFLLALISNSVYENYLAIEYKVSLWLFIWCVIVVHWFLMFSSQISFNVQQNSKSTYILWPSSLWAVFLFKDTLFSVVFKPSMRAQMCSEIFQVESENAKQILWNSWARSWSSCAALCALPHGSSVSSSAWHWLTSTELTTRPSAQLKFVFNFSCKRIPWKYLNYKTIIHQFR